MHSGDPPNPPRIDRPEPGLRRLLAPNPSAMTLHGTNTWLVGEGDVAVIDPGPALPAHLAAILAALAPGERISHIFVTHAHLDHSPLAALLSAETRAPVLAFGDARAGRSERMEALARQGVSGGGEGVDSTFHPDARLQDGDSVSAGDWTLSALHTPGHFGNHLCFAYGHTVFSGDHVMGWASSLVSPPDGDMGAYMRSLDRLAAVGARRLYPGHGAPVEDPASRIAELIRHRQTREAAIRASLAAGPASARALAARIYTDTPPALMPAAARNVFAHLLDLADRNLAEAAGEPAIDTAFLAT